MKENFIFSKTLLKEFNSVFWAKLMLISFFSLFFSYSAHGQVSAYAFSESTETYTQITGTTSTATGDDGTQTNIPIGFDFNFGGINYTAIGISTNGVIRLGSNATNTAISSGWTNLLSSTSSNRPLIAVFWDDNHLSTGTIRYALTGSSPNRVFTVNFHDTKIGGGGSTSGSAVSSLLRLYETTNIIEMVYSTPFTTSNTVTASVGLNDMSSFLSVTPDAVSTASGITANNSINATVMSNLAGKKLIFSPPNCLAPSGLNVTNLASNAATLNWTASTSNPTGGYEWELRTSGAAGSGSTGLINSGQTSSSTVALTGLTSETNYTYHVRSLCSISDFSNWANSTLFTGYCLVSTTFTSDYTSAFSTTGGLTNLTYTASAQPTGSYSNQTAQVLQAIEGATINFSHTFVGGSNGLKIWIDWNNDLIFDVSEEVFYLANTSVTKTGSFVIPGATPVGNYRMRVRAQWGSTANPPACGNVGYGSTGDYTIQVMTPPACLPVGAMTNTQLSLTSASHSWVAPSTAPDSYEWIVTTDATPPASGTATTDLTATSTDLSADTPYYLHVRSVCGAIFSDWQTSNFQLGYCNPVYTFGKTDGDLISNVVIVGTTLSNNTGTAPVNPAYTYFTGQPNYTASLTGGQAYDVTVSVGTFGGNNVAVWIDFNEDGQFTTDERIGFTATAIPGNGSGTFTVILPCNPNTGIKRMRVRGAWNVPGSSINPCATYGYGETEDYDVTILPAPPLATPIVAAQTVCEGTTVSQLVASLPNLISTVNSTTFRTADSATDWTITNATIATAAGGYLHMNNIASEAISPLFDLTGLQNVNLAFSVAKFGSGVDGPVTISVSNDGGITWTAQVFDTQTPLNSTYIDQVVPITVTGNQVKFKISRGNSPSDKRFRDFVLTSGVPAGETDYVWFTSATEETPLAGDALVESGTYFVAQTVNGCESTRASAVITVLATPAITLSSSNASICSGSAADLTVTSDHTLYTYAWTPGNITGATVSVSPTETTTYTVTATDTVTLCTISSNVTIEVIPVPTQTVDVSEILVCVDHEGPITVEAEATTGEVFGYTLNLIDSFGDGWNGNSMTLLVNGVSVLSEVTFATGFNSSLPFNVSGGDAITTLWNGGGFYVEECSYTITDNNGQVVFTATASATGPTLVSTPLVVASSVIVSWWTAPIGGSQVGTGNSLNLVGTSILPNTNVAGVYSVYAQSENLGCVIAERAPITVTVFATPAPTGLPIFTFCPTAGSTLADIAVTGTDIQWYATATSTTPLASTNALSSGYYFASQTLNGCESQSRLAVFTLGIATPAPVAAPLQTFCLNATVADLTASGENILWYATATGGEALDSTTALVQGTYFVSQTTGGCESPRAAVAVNFNNVIAPMVSATAASCSGSGVATITNYDANATYVFVPSGPTVTGGVISGMTFGETYTVTSVSNGCESIVSNTFSVSEILPTPAAPTGDAIQAPLEGSTIEALVVVGENIVWYATEADALAGTNPLSASEVLQDETFYYATQTINGCTSAPFEVYVDLTLSSGGFDMSSLKYYPNPVVSTFNMSYSETITQVTVMNMLGQSVMKQSNETNAVSIDMSSLPAGTYMVQIESDDMSTLVKVVKR